MKKTEGLKKKASRKETKKAKQKITGGNRERKEEIYEK